MPVKGHVVNARQKLSLLAAPHQAGIVNTILLMRKPRSEEVQ